MERITIIIIGHNSRRYNVIDLILKIYVLVNYTTIVHIHNNIQIYTNIFVTIFIKAYVSQIVIAHNYSRLVFIFCIPSCTIHFCPLYKNVYFISKVKQI